MFSYRFPDGVLSDFVSTNRDGDVKFNPAPHKQCYKATLNVVQNPQWSEQIKKVVEFGCGEMELLPLMRRIETLEHIIQVDTDADVLAFNKDRGTPLPADYLKERECPLRIEIFQGDIAHSVENIRNMDVVIALEVLEYLEQDVLEKVPENVFGFVQPKLAIFSTPNRDFNVCLRNVNENGLRSRTHKFEWSRKEFQDWAKKICTQYQNYSVSFVGIGNHPPTHQKVGHFMQMAIFARNDLICRPLNQSISSNLQADLRPHVQYKEIYAVNFPRFTDERTSMQKIQDETMAYIGRSHKIEKNFNPELSLYQIPIKPIYAFAESIGSQKEDVLNALGNVGIKVENEFIILSEEYVEENYGQKGCDLCPDEDGEDFLQFELYQWNEDNNEDSIQNVSSSTIEDDEPEENWD